MRLLIATESNAPSGGIQTYLQTLLPELVARGHQVALLVARREAAPHDSIDPQNVCEHVWDVSDGKQSGNWQACAAWRPACVLLHGMNNVHAEECLTSLFPAVWFAHGFSGSCVSGTKMHAWPHAVPCERRFGTACLALYYPRRCGGLHPLTALHDFQVVARRHAVMARCRCVLVASRFMQQEYQREGFPAVEVLPYPPTLVTPPRFAAPVATPHRLVFMGRLTPLKGVALLLRALPGAAARLGRPLFLQVAGSGPELGNLQRLARALAVPAEFCGQLSRAACASLLDAAHLLVVPSLWPEPFGLVGVEAAGRGVPAVAFDVGGIRDWLLEGESGELTATLTAESFCAAMVRALDSPSHYQHLCAGARRSAERFTLAAHLDSLDALLERHLQYSR